MKKKNINKNKIVLFAKYPEKGKVKTRIAKALGEESALEIYLFLLNKTIKTLSKCTFAEKIIYVDEENRIEKFKKMYPGFEIKGQLGHDLGERLEQAMIRELNEKSSLMFIGADCLDLNPDLISDAFNRLDDNDVVIGPATDGGYYLIGLKQKYPTLFQNIDWSTDKVLDQTLSIAKSLNLKVSVLETLNDIDTLEDILRSIHKIMLENKNRD